MSEENSNSAVSEKISMTGKVNWGREGASAEAKVEGTPNQSIWNKCNNTIRFVAVCAVACVICWAFKDSLPKSKS